MPSLQLHFRCHCLLGARSMSTHVDFPTFSLFSFAGRVWNEPQGCGFFCPRPGQTNLEAYFELYNVTARAIAAVDPLISVGGPATAGLAWVTEFINITGAGAIMPAHFLSTHHYPTDIRPQGSRTQWEDDIIAKSIEAAAAGLPLVLTEISAGLGTQYDPPFAGSFILHAAAAFLGVPNVPTLSYWTFTDVFEEPGFQSETWINTYGIQTKYGVPKPAYRQVAGVICAPLPFFPPLLQLLLHPHFPHSHSLPPLLCAGPLRCWLPCRRREFL